MGLLDCFEKLLSLICYNTEAELKVANVSIIGERLFGAEDSGASEYSTSWESTIEGMKLNLFYLREPHIAHRLCSDYAKRLFGAEGAVILSQYSGAWKRSTSWEYTIGEIKFNFFYLGGPHTAHRVWSDYAKMDAVVYIVSANTREQFLQQIEELHALFFDMEAFANVPFLIFCIRNPGIYDLPEEEMVALLNLTDANIRPFEVFVAEEYNREQFLDGIEWLSHHITTN